MFYAESYIVNITSLCMFYIQTVNCCFSPTAVNATVGKVRIIRQRLRHAPMLHSSMQIWSTLAEAAVMLLVCSYYTTLDITIILFVLSYHLIDCSFK